MNMRPIFYVLDANHNPTPVDGPIEWVNYQAKNKTRVAKTTVKKILISTVFLGVDQNFMPDGLPLLFETMVFGGTYNLSCRRYSTWDEAIQGHREMVDMVKKGLSFRRNKKLTNGEPQ